MKALHIFVLWSNLMKVRLIFVSAINNIEKHLIQLHFYSARKMIWFDLITWKRDLPFFTIKTFSLVYERTLNFCKRNFVIVMKTLKFNGKLYGGRKVSE